MNFVKEEGQGMDCKKGGCYPLIIPHCTSPKTLTCRAFNRVLSRIRILSSFRRGQSTIRQDHKTNVPRRGVCREAGSKVGPAQTTPLGKRPRLPACTLRGHAPAGGVRVIHSVARFELGVPPLFTHTSAPLAHKMANAPEMVSPIAQCHLGPANTLGGASFSEDINGRSRNHARPSVLSPVTGGSAHEPAAFFRPCEISSADSPPYIPYGPIYSANDRYLSLCNPAKFCGGAAGESWQVLAEEPREDEEWNAVLVRSQCILRPFPPSNFQSAGRAYSNETVRSGKVCDPDPALAFCCRKRTQRDVCTYG
ncbi:hypothetical protein KM043_016410 [Ampulex compressa]|nr:hypothetical protein KM043_016410 [Ampulex compressa]